MTEWNGLFQHYESPPYVLPHTSGAYSFGIAGQRGGVFSAFSDHFLTVDSSVAKLRPLTLASRPWNWSPLSLAWSWIC